MHEEELILANLEMRARSYFLACPSKIGRWGFGALPVLAHAQKRQDFVFLEHALNLRMHTLRLLVLLAPHSSVLALHAHDET